MSKLETLKSFIHRIICQNEVVNNALREYLQEERIKCLYVQIVPNCGHYANISDISVLVGVPDVVEYYNLAKKLDCGNKLSSYLRAIDIVSKCSTTEISINFFAYNCEEHLINSVLEESDLLNNESPTIHDNLTMQALSFSLFHEIGHLLNDKSLSSYSQMTKEYKADEFAFVSITSNCTNYDTAAFFGALISIGQILLKRCKDEEVKDTEHPHSIERMYELFHFWHISDESPFWETAYSIIREWTKRYNIDISWIKGSSSSYKEKVYDAYEHFRKK